MKEIIKKYALHNAVLHQGKAEVKHVMSKLIAEKPEYRDRVKEIIPKVKEIIEKVNKLSIRQQESKLRELAPELLEKPKAEKKELPELPNVKGKVVMRFAPMPSGPLHIGHSRVAVLNDEYVKRYGGKLILRIEDTDPKRINPEAYDWVREDLEWLNVKGEEVLQSNRFELYYKHAEELLTKGYAYVCKCKPEQWRKLKLKSKPCVHRGLSPDKQLEEWEKLKEGAYSEGEALVIIKTNLSHKNPALRDFPALRIVEHPHPLTHDKYLLYPLMNFSVAVDDHLLNLSHVLRGKDHLNNTCKQIYVFDYFGWEKPEYIHYGIVSIRGTLLKTSKIREGIEKRKYSGWSDPQLGTLRALAKRGIKPEAIRRYWVEAGIKGVEVEFSWKTLYSFNKELVDPKANRYFFVWNPKKISIKGVDEVEASVPLHPDFSERGVKKRRLKPPVVYICKDDYRKGECVRLKDMCNVKLADRAVYLGEDLGLVRRGARIIHWVGEKNLPTKVVMPNSEVIRGYCEPEVVNEVGRVVQFERFGFVRVHKANHVIECYFTHK